MDQVTEKDLMTDLLQTQRFVSASYNGKASETKSIALKEDLLKILGDEQLCLSLIFDAMDRRGWYQTQPAKQQDIQNAISKFNNPQVFTAMEQVLQPQYQISKEATTMYGQTFPTNVLHDYTQTRGDYGYGQQGYAGAGIGAAGAGMGAAGAGMGTAGQGIGAAGFGAQGAFGQAGGYQGMGATGVGFQGGGVGYQGAGWGGQAGLGYQGAGVGYQGAGWGGQAGVGYGGVTYPVGGIMNAAAQSLQSNFPGLRSAVMSDWTQSRPDVYGYQGAYVAPYQTQFQAQQPQFQVQQPQFGFQGQIPQAGFPAQNVLATFQQTRLDPGLGTRGFGAGAGYGAGNIGGYGVGNIGGYGVGNIGGVGAGNIGGVGAGNIGGVGVGATGGWGAGGYGAGGGIGGYGAGIGGTTMGTTMGTTAGGIYGGSIMNAAANTLQSNIGNLRGSVLNDWSLTSPENQNEFLAQQRQFGTTQIGATPTGLQAQVIQSQPYAQRNVAGLAGTSTWAGAGLSGTAGYTGGIQVQ